MDDEKRAGGFTDSRRLTDKDVALLQKQYPHIWAVFQEMQGAVQTSDNRAAAASEQLSQASNDLAGAIDHVTTLERQLDTYGNHTPSCDTVHLTLGQVPPPLTARCSCGWELLKETIT